MATKTDYAEKDFLEMAYATSGGSSNEMTALYDASYNQLLESAAAREKAAKFYRLAEDLDIRPADKDAVLIANIQPEYSETLFNICKRSEPEIWCCPVSSEEAGCNTVAIFKKQEEEFHKAVMEASVRSGLVSEVSLDSLTRNDPSRGRSKSIADMMEEHGNCLRMAVDITPDQFGVFKRDVSALGIRVTFAASAPYRNEYDDGKECVCIGFPERAEAKYDIAGNRYKEPPVYDMSAIMQALMLKKNLLSKSHTIEATYGKMHQQEQFRHQKVDELIRDDRGLTFDWIAKEVKESSLDVTDKVPLLYSLDRLRDQRIPEEQFRMEVNSLDGVPKSMKRDIIDAARDVGNVKYIIEATMERGKDGSIAYIPNMDESLQLGRTLTWKQKGREDRVFTDPRVIRRVLEGNLKNMQEKSCDGKEHTFVVLTDCEYNKLMEHVLSAAHFPLAVNLTYNKYCAMVGSELWDGPAVLNEKGELNVDGVRFLKENDKAIRKMSLRESPTEMDTYERLASYVTKAMDERKEEFVLKAGKDEVKGIDVIEDRIQYLIEYEGPEMADEPQYEEMIIKDSLCELDTAIFDAYLDSSFDSAAGFGESIDERIEEYQTEEEDRTACPALEIDDER